MKNDYLVSYHITVGDSWREYPIIIKIGSSVHGETLNTIFKDIEYIFIDTHEGSYLYIILSEHQFLSLRDHGCKNKIVKVDLGTATGAAKWELRGKKALIYKKEWIQPCHKKFEEEDFILYINQHGTSSSSPFLVSNWSPIEMHDMLAVRDDSGLADNSAEYGEIASAIGGLNI